MTSNDSKTQYVAGRGNTSSINGNLTIEMAVGLPYFRHNTERKEWSYSGVLKDGKIDKTLVTVNGRVHEFVDYRFSDGRVSVLVETKQNFDTCLEAAKKQLQCYVEFEKVLSGHNRIIAILANTNDNRIKVWQGDIKDENFLSDETNIRPFEVYRERFFGRQNNKKAVIRATHELNEILHKVVIPEEIRSQFVGTCLLALKELKPEDFDYNRSNTRSIIATMEGCLESLLQGNLNRAEKLTLLRNRVLNDQSVRSLSTESFRKILDKVSADILPFINDKTAKGQDILNLFFTTFNKYAGKKNKNQAFTPDHIVHFLCKVVGVNRNSRVLDPCCGSGAFLVRALTDAVNDCNGNVIEEKEVKEHHIYGIEVDEYAFGLSTTNMLIHGDGNSNVLLANCFEREDWIKDARIDTVLMNPPYNAPRARCHPDYVRNWSNKDKKGEDPTNGFHFVEYIANTVGRGKLVALLPLVCAMGKNKEMQAIKERMLQKHHLDAVFTLPRDVFHPGAAVCTCCMIFDLGVRHANAPIQETFFGFFTNDGFVKRKNYGRVETSEGIWEEIEHKWLDLYRKRQEKSGISSVKTVTAYDEWLCEAQMQTDTTALTAADVERVVRDCAAFVRQHSKIPQSLNTPIYENVPIKKFPIGGDNGLFDVQLSKGDLKKTDAIPLDEQQGDELPLISAGDFYNGFIGYVEKTGDGKAVPFKGNTITVDMFCRAYYQPTDYYAVSHGRVNILIPNFKMTPNIALFICSVINNERGRFCYGRAAYSGVISDLEIYLPVDSQGNPNWEFMERIVSELPSTKLLEEC